MSPTTPSPASSWVLPIVSDHPPSLTGETDAIPCFPDFPHPLPHRPPENRLIPDSRTIYWHTPAHPAEIGTPSGASRHDRSSGHHHSHGRQHPSRPPQSTRASDKHPPFPTVSRHRPANNIPGHTITDTIRTPAYRDGTDIRSTRHIDGTKTPPDSIQLTEIGEPHPLFIVASIPNRSFMQPFRCYRKLQKNFENDRIHPRPAALMAAPARFSTVKKR